MYWIYILSIHPGCLRGNFQYTPALEKRMAIHCLELGWIGKYAPSANCLRGRIFQYTPFLGSVLLQYCGLKSTGIWGSQGPLVILQSWSRKESWPKLIKSSQQQVCCAGCAHRLESSVYSDSVIHNLDHAVDIELCTCVVFGVYARQQRRGNLNVSQYNEKITLITLISFRFNEIYTLKQSGVKNWNLEILTSRRLMFEIKTKLLNL